MQYVKRGWTIWPINRGVIQSILFLYRLVIFYLQFMYHRVSSVERGVYEVTVYSHCPYLVFFCLRCQGDNVICVTRHTCWPFYVPVQAIVLSSLLRVLVLVLRISHTFVILSPRSEDEAMVRQRIFP